jgi:hypothetical protein
LLGCFNSGFASREADKALIKAIERGENPLAVAQYCGTSLAMIQATIAGRWACGSIKPFSNRKPKIP